MRHPLMRSASALAMSCLLVACVNTSDTRMLEAAESLVPPESQITETLENTGLSVLVGSYSVHLTISDGGLGPDLLDAIEQQADAAGWEPTYRREASGGVELGFARSGLQADVDVRTKKETVNAAIIVSADS